MGGITTNQAPNSFPSSSFSIDSWEFLSPLGLILMGKFAINGVWVSSRSSFIFSRRLDILEGANFELDELESADVGDNGGDSVVVSWLGIGIGTGGSPWMDVGGKSPGENGNPGYGGGTWVNPNKDGGIIPPP